MKALVDETDVKERGGIQKGKNLHDDLSGQPKENLYIILLMLLYSIMQDTNLTCNKSTMHKHNIHFQVIFVSALSFECISSVRLHRGFSPPLPNEK